jgi:cellulose synthase/poly-beta-1,6-N-acetylglucosamine synthase-like glycosyltransferase/peptidoglycan/xylan/chitin deacetylase (PgdA/CDA1 family)
MRRRIERPPAHWLVLAAFVAILLALLLAHGLATRTTGGSRTSNARPTTSPLEGSRPIVSARNGKLESSQPAPGRRIALTFDDGPDPRWTPRIARVLKRFGVPATFFVIGSRVAEHAGIVRDLSRQGMEIGNHTFTHADLRGLSKRERDLELSLTRSAVAAASGASPRLLRPPYASRPETVDDDFARTLASVAEDGNILVFADYDSQDWRKPGVGAILRHATPPGRQGGIIQLHDGGGDRGQTVAALERLIPRLQRRGFRFVRVATLLGVPRSSVDVPVSGTERLKSRLFVSALTVAAWITTVVTSLLIPIISLTFMRILLAVLLARRHSKQIRRRSSDPAFLPPVSIVVPAFNEAAGIERSVQSLAESEYPEFEIVVVDDGSEDGTADLVEAMKLERVRVIRQANTGKSGALNNGIAAATHDVIATADADTVFESQTLRRLVQPFQDPEMGAVAGNAKVGNRRGLLGRWQHIEYVIGFNLDRRFCDLLGCIPTLPGAVSAFRRRALKEVGGFSAATLAEDTDVALAIGRAGWRIACAEDARGWTEAPESLSAFWRQRYRWSYGTLQAVWKNKAAIWRRGEGRVGRRGIPYLVLFHLALPALAPLVDLFTVYGILFLDAPAVIGSWLAFNALLIVPALFAFRLEGESVRPLWAMPLQQFVYRQLVYLVIVQSIVSAALGLRLRWQHVERTGEMDVAPATRLGQ